MEMTTPRSRGSRAPWSTNAPFEERKAPPPVASRRPRGPFSLSMVLKHEQQQTCEEEIDNQHEDRRYNDGGSRGPADALSSAFHPKPFKAANRRDDEGEYDRFREALNQVPEI